MPHFTIEYSANVGEKADIGQLCQRVEDVILESGVFELGAVRVRAYPAAYYAVADRHPDNGFLDMQFRIGKGRSAEEKKRVGEAIMALCAETLSDLLARPHFALSLEIREIDSEFSWRNNAMHPRLRGK